MVHRDWPPTGEICLDGFQGALIRQECETLAPAFPFYEEACVLLAPIWKAQTHQFPDIALPNGLAYDFTYADSTAPAGEIGQGELREMKLPLENGRDGPGRGALPLQLPPEILWRRCKQALPANPALCFYGGRSLGKFRSQIATGSRLLDWILLLTP